MGEAPPFGHSKTPSCPTNPVNPTSPICPNSKFSKSLNQELQVQALDEGGMLRLTWVLGLGFNDDNRVYRTLHIWI